MNRKERREYLKNLRKEAQQGDAEAQFYLGNMYYNGEGVPFVDGSGGEGVTQDYAEAAKWYRKAAEQGHPWAQTYLGWMYDTGKGVTQDYAEAVKWYRKAAEQGNAMAQHFLGLLLNKIPEAV